MSFDDREVVQMTARSYESELAILIGRGKIKSWDLMGWDGSYVVLHRDGAVGHWYPSKFRKTGFTVAQYEAANRNLRSLIVSKGRG